MKLFTVFMFTVLCGLHSVAAVKVLDLKYDSVTDELVIKGEFPGKCLPHQLVLTALPGNGQTFRYFVDVTNASDPCNAPNEISQRFSMASIVLRPAQILVSPFADGSKAHALEIPVHKAATIQDVNPREDGHSITVSLLVPKKATNSRFYIEVSDKCQGNHPPTCEAFVRDKEGYAHSQREKDATVILPTDHVQGPVTLKFSLKNGRSKTLQIR